MKNKNKFLVILMVFGNLLYLQAAEGGSQEKPTVPRVRLPFCTRLFKPVGSPRKVLKNDCLFGQLARTERPALVRDIQQQAISDF